MAIAVLAPLAAVLNWITTGDHLLRTVGEGYWPVAGVDLALLAVGVVAALTVRALNRRAVAHPLSSMAAAETRHA